MAQILRREKGLKLDVDRSFIDGGQPSRQVAVGGGRIELAQAQPPRPTIHMKAKAFFYDDGSPVTVPTDVEHLPDKYRRMALDFLAKAAGAEGGGVALSRAEDPKKIRPQKKGTRKVVTFDPASALGHRGGVVAEKLSDRDRAGV